MEKLEQFRQAVQAAPTVLLATAGKDGRVTMRTVSPVSYQEDILIFTDGASQKYRQMQENPRCCISAGPFLAEASAAFRGATMLPENQALREAYCEKFPGAFDDGLAFGGRNAEFLLLHPIRLSGWAFPNDVPVEDGIPTVPFDIPLP